MAGIFSIFFPQYPDTCSTSCRVGFGVSVKIG